MFIRRTTPAEIIAAARQYLGAPYLHAGRRPDGCDCVGLLIMTGRDVGVLVEDSDIPTYNVGNQSRALLATITQWLYAIDPAQADPGDVVGLAHEPGKMFPRHVGILTDGGIIQMSPHAHACVVEHSFTDEIKSLVVAAWRFPNL